MMMEAYFDIGGQIVRLIAPAEDLELSGGVLEPFRVEKCPWDFQLDIRFADDLVMPAGERVFSSPERQVYFHNGAFVTYVGTGPEHAYLRMERRGNITQAQANRSRFVGPIHSKAVLTALEAEHLVTCGDGILLHASFIAWENRAILFTAPSGTGKSTQAELWRSLRGARVLNGDRSVVRKGPSGFEALGVPFSGSSGICHTARLPLAAIVYLSQAGNTTVTLLRGARAFRAIWEGCSLHTWCSADVERCSRTVSELAASVPVYHLACTPDVSAVEALETKLR